MEKNLLVFWTLPMSFFNVITEYFENVAHFLHSDGKRGRTNCPGGRFRKSRSLFLDAGYNSSSVNWPYLKLAILTGSRTFIYET